MEGHVRRVLVCDDERHIVRLIQVNLERQGYVVECAYSGAEAIRLLQTSSFDLAVIDPEMPGMSGYELVEWIRGNEATAAMQVIMLDGQRPVLR